MQKYRIAYAHLDAAGEAIGVGNGELDLQGDLSNPEVMTAVELHILTECKKENSKVHSVKVVNYRAA